MPTADTSIQIEISGLARREPRPIWFPVRSGDHCLNAAASYSIDESSIRYDGWRIVAVCFVVATFGWAFGFYGQSVYLAELHRQHGWPASLISAATTSFYLFGALLVVFVAETVKKFGPRNCLLAGTSAMAVAVILMGQVSQPWQLYLANAVLAVGWRAPVWR